MLEKTATSAEAEAKSWIYARFIALQIDAIESGRLEKAATAA